MEDLAACFMQSEYSLLTDVRGLLGLLDGVQVHKVHQPYVHVFYDLVFRIFSGSVLVASAPFGCNIVATNGQENIIRAHQSPTF